MALMFQRLAQNFIKNGYFPTDEETIRRTLNAIRPNGTGLIRILDNCCGEGIALAEVQHHLCMAQLEQATDEYPGTERVESFGIEYNKERAWHAKSLLNRCIHGDINDCMVGQQQFGLVWLNPPYGDLVNDSDHLNRDSGGRQRLEKQFYRQTYGVIQYGGILILILPYYAYDKELSVWIARHFEQVKIFRAPEQQFKQTVLFGVRRRVKETNTQIRDLLMAIGKGDLDPEELFEEWPDEPYIVPSAITDKPVKFHYVKLDEAQLKADIEKHRGMWNRFEMLMIPHLPTFRRPLCQLSNWHLALALAAGQVSGVVKSNDGRTFVIKGDTHKDKVHKVEHEIREDGSVSETRISTDRFVPAIRAIDFTPDSPTYGQVMVIR